MKAIIRFTTKDGKKKIKNTFYAFDFKGWTFANKSNILTLENGNKIYKYKNVIYESIEEEYKQKK